MFNNDLHFVPCPVVRLSDIQTIGELYNSGVLKRSENVPDKDPSPNLLDRVSLYQGDITTLEVDAIVNAANKSLLGGGGDKVDGAIHYAAGRQLLQECRELNGCNTGQSKITRGYKLPSRHVIHAVGPVYSLSDVDKKARQLASCYRTSLELAVENSIRHIAFPSIATGIYGYPITDATHIALKEVRQFFDSEAGGQLAHVVFVAWSDKDRRVYESLIPEYFPLVPEKQQEIDMEV